MLSLEGIERALPYYLSAERREGVRRGLAELPNIKFFYLEAYEGELLQGDAWEGLVVVDFLSGQRKNIRGLLLSNSCDMDRNNNSITKHQVVFVPIFRLSRLADRWRREGITENRIASTLQNIRRQENDSFFYLPQGAGIDEESAAYLDDVHTMPASAFEEVGARRKLSTLSDAGFYLFIFKLSLHFCRMHEDVDRSAGAERKGAPPAPG